MKFKKQLITGILLLVTVGLGAGCVNKEKLNQSLSTNAVVLADEANATTETTADGVSESEKVEITIIQSSTLALPLVLELTKDSPYDVSAVGNVAAIEAVNSGVAQLALVDGQLDETQAKTDVIAYASIAIIVNSNSSLANITRDEIMSFFLGEVDTIQGEQFSMVLTDKNIPSRSLLEEIFELKGDVNGIMKSLIPSTALIVGTDEEVISTVSTTPNAIGIVLSEKVGSQVKSLTIEGIEMNQATLSDGSYFAAKPIVIMALSSNEAVFTSFIELSKSEQGKTAIKNMGYTPK